MKPKKLTTPSIRNSISRPPLRRGFLLIPLALAWFALSPASLAQLPSPTPDGGYPGQNTAEGDQALFNVVIDSDTGVDNTAIGFQALFSNTTGSLNTATGYQALYSNTTAIFNTATGFDALFFNTTGTFNTANGVSALFSNTTGVQNTANGSLALFSNTIGDNNTAIGTSALEFNTTGVENTATGVDALFSNTTGFDNTANGFGALFSNTAGSLNTAIGFNTLAVNTTGVNNTANGSNALDSNTTGSRNTADGFGALLRNTTGSNNAAHGVSALQSNTTGGANTASGVNALLKNTIGSSNIALGASAGSTLTTGSNNIDIGNLGVAAEANTVRIGTGGTQTNTYIAGINGVTVAGGVGVIIDTNGHLGTVVSSARFKDEIKPMDKASEAILALQPVTFRYKHELDPEGIPQFGLVAEQVEKVNPDLVARDEEGKPYTVRYEAVNAMLLNEFLKEHSKVEAQDRKVQELEATVGKLQAAFKDQAAQIQKVSAQLEVTKPAPQMVVNNQ